MCSKKKLVMLAMAFLLAGGVFMEYSPISQAGRFVGSHSDDTLKAQEQAFEATKKDATHVLQDSQRKAERVIEAGEAMHEGATPDDVKDLRTRAREFRQIIPTIEASRADFEAQISGFEEELNAAFDRSQKTIEKFTDDELRAQAVGEFNVLQKQRQLKIKKAKEALQILDVALLQAKNVDTLGEWMESAAAIKDVLKRVDSTSLSIASAAASYKFKTSQVLALLSQGNTAANS